MYYVKVTSFYDRKYPSAVLYSVYEFWTAALFMTSSLIIKSRSVEITSTTYCLEKLIQARPVCINTV